MNSKRFIEFEVNIWLINIFRRLYKASLPPARGKVTTAWMQEIEQRMEQLPRMGVIEKHSVLAHPHPSLPPYRGKVPDQRQGTRNFDQEKFRTYSFKLHLAISIARAKFQVTIKLQLKGSAHDRTSCFILTIYLQECPLLFGSPVLEIVLDFIEKIARVVVSTESLLMRYSSQCGA